MNIRNLAFPLLLGVASLLQAEKLAVMPLGGAGVSEALKESMTDRLGNALVSAGDTLIERQQLSLVMKEQGLQQLTCEGMECTEVGKLLNVDRLVTGKVSRINRLLSATVQLIDVQSATVVKSVVFDWEGSEEGFTREGSQQIARQLKGDLPTNFSQKERLNWETPTAWALAGLSGASLLFAWHFNTKARDAYDEFKIRVDRGFSPSNQDIETAQEQRQFSLWSAGGLALTSALFFWSPWVDDQVSAWYTTESAGVMWSMSF